MSYDLIDFLCWYEALAEQGACDALYGMEFYRVLQEWLQAGRPDPERYIPIASNRPSVYVKQ